MEVEDKFAHDPVQRPHKGEQGDELDGDAYQDQEEVGDGEVGEEGVGRGAEGLSLEDCYDDQYVTNNTKHENYSKIITQYKIKNIKSLLYP